MGDRWQSSQVRIHSFQIFISLSAIELPRHDRAQLPLACVARSHRLYEYLLGVIANPSGVRRDVGAHDFS